MTNDEINVAIALELDFYVIQDGSGSGYTLRYGHKTTRWSWKDTEAEAWQDAPNYAGDLNAMHEAEYFVANSIDGPRYAVELTYLVLGIPDTPDREFVLNRWSLSRLAHATARQRSEAFLRTVRRWKETP